MGVDCMCIWPDECGGTGILYCKGCGGDQCICKCCGERECGGCFWCEDGDWIAWEYADGERCKVELVQGDDEEEP